MLISMNVYLCKFFLISLKHSHFYLNLYFFILRNNYYIQHAINYSYFVLNSCSFKLYGAVLNVFFFFLLLVCFVMFLKASNESFYYEMILFTMFSKCQLHLFLINILNWHWHFNPLCSPIMMSTAYLKNWILSDDYLDLL